MLLWSTDIYMDDKVKKSPQKYRRRIERRKALPGAYCITLPVNEDNCMDIYYSGELWFQYYRRKKLEIIGLAASREGVEQILVQMTSDMAERYGKINVEVVRKHFFSK